MKQVMFIIGFLLGSFLLFSSFSIRENPQDPPRGKKGEKATRHIRLEKIENGEKTVLDTVIEGNQVFVWNGDTIGSAKEFEWFAKENFELDSLPKDFNFHFFELDEEGDDRFVFAPLAPPAMHAPTVPHVITLNKKRGGNVIDLSDQEIISYKKKKMSGGREKITIIRNEPSETTEEEDIVVTIPEIPEPAVWIGKDGVEKIRKVKVIKNEDGEIEVIENEGVGGKHDKKEVIIIRKKAEDGSVDVEYEMHENEENKENK